MHLQDLSRRIQQLIGQSEIVLLTKRENTGKRFSTSSIDSGKMAGLRASVLSFIAMVYGKDHSHYSEFDEATRHIYSAPSAEQGHEILLAI